MPTILPAPGVCCCHKTARQKILQIAKITKIQRTKTPKIQKIKKPFWIQTGAVCMELAKIKQWLDAPSRQQCACPGPSNYALMRVYNGQPWGPHGLSNLQRFEGECLHCVHCTLFLRRVHPERPDSPPLSVCAVRLGAVLGVPLFLHHGVRPERFLNLSEMASVVENRKKIHLPIKTPQKNGKNFRLENGWQIG